MCVLCKYVHIHIHGVFLSHTKPLYWTGDIETVPEATITAATYYYFLLCQMRFLDVWGNFFDVAQYMIYTNMIC